MAKTYLATRSDIADMATNTNLSAHKNDKNNPHSVTATQLGAEVTSNRTDDIASNAEDSSRYPSTKGVAEYVGDNYLPLAGGELSLDNRSLWLNTNSSAAIRINRDNANARFSMWIGESGYANIRNSNVQDNTYSGIYFPNNMDAKENLVRIEYNDGSGAKYASLFGGHNQEYMPFAMFDSQLNIFSRLGFSENKTIVEVLSAMPINTVYKTTHNSGSALKITDLPASSNNSTYGQLILMKGYNDNYRTAIYIKQNGTNSDTGDIYVRTISTRDTGWRKLGEDSKPTGTYTGTGSYTTQNISVGGTGSVIVVTSNAGSALVTPNGATAWANSSGDYYSQHTGSSLSASEISYSNGVLRIASTNGYVNNSGTTYTYQVL